MKRNEAGAVSALTKKLWQKIAVQFDCNQVKFFQGRFKRMHVHLNPIYRSNVEHYIKFRSVRAWNGTCVNSFKCKFSQTS